MKRRIFGFQRRVWWSKWTPASSSSLTPMPGTFFSLFCFQADGPPAGSRRPRVARQGAIRLGGDEDRFRISVESACSTMIPSQRKGEDVSEHQTATPEQWQAAREELAKLEAEHDRLGKRVTEQRRKLPWVPVTKEYEFDTEEGPRTLSELFQGRSQLLAYNIMFGPDYELGACPGCSSAADQFDGTLVHLHHRDVTFICFSRAPLPRLVAYKRRMGWQFPYVSTYGTEFPFDFGLAMTVEEAQENPEVRAVIDSPPPWLERWGRQVGASLQDGLREAPGFIAFAQENGTVYHTYTVTAPDPFVAPYHSFLLERVARGEERDPG